MLAWKNIWASAAAVRAVLILYAVWHDSTFAVKYTDVDYLVFNDAAHFVAEGESPYRRATYRYTPLLAYVLVPNAWLHAAWGKLVFAGTDLLCGYLIQRILAQYEKVTESRSKMLVSMWLFNPIVVNVSTRGNAEALVSLLVLASLWGVLERRIRTGGVMLGLAVHLKIYPIIYALPLYLAIEDEVTPRKAAAQTKLTEVLRIFFSRQRLTFTAVSASTFIGMSYLFYSIYGFEFVHQAYLYHVTRADHRHNFSLYFYQLYLAVCATQENTKELPSHELSHELHSSADIFRAQASSITHLVAFVPQVSPRSSRVFFCWLRNLKKKSPAA